MFSESAIKADDFKKNAGLYDHALSHYEREGFRLILLGDNEELWETHMGRILKLYRPLIEVFVVNRNDKRII